MKTLLMLIKIQTKIWSIGFWSITSLVKTIYSESYQLIVSKDDWYDVLCGSKWTVVSDEDDEVFYHLTIWEVYKMVRSFLIEWAYDGSTLHVHPVTETYYERSLEGC